MKPLSLVAIIAASLLVGAVLVVACSDDSPGDADAAVCDCPAAEAPLTGRIRSFTGTRPIPANGTEFVSAGCPTGATILGGGCRVDNPAGQTLVEGGIDRTGGVEGDYVCQWRSTSPQVATGTAEAICLVPAQ